MTESLAVAPSVLRRTFDAPREMVYRAWTEANHLCRWQVPSPDIACEYVHADIRTGGSSLHKMVMPGGKEMWLLTRYRALEPFHTIAFIQYESNAQGDALPPSMPNWPKEILATITLSEVEGKTHMQFSWQPLNPTPEEAEAWEASRPQHGKGWGGSFELLAAYLRDRLTE